MKKNFKKILCTALSLTMVAGSIVLPSVASADEVTPIFEGDTVTQEWKFDFGSAENVMEGYTAVTPDRNVITSKDYGFIGNDGNGSKVSEFYDSFRYQEGQNMNLQVGGSGVNDAIGIVADPTSTYPEYTTGEYYPVSFGMYVDNNSYYRVKATLTTFDSSKPAEVSLYSERRHPVVHKQTIAAGETLTVDFSVDVESIYLKNQGSRFVDDMLNLELLGDNAAFSSVIIQKVTQGTTLWILGDSTVTDGSASIPYFDLQNYTGVGAYISKYLPSNIAVSNQGEGGLTATDKAHFAIADENIKAGDFMYVEYGHNHKNPSGDPDAATRGKFHSSEFWLNDYLSSLPRYYESCKKAGATLVVVGNIDRHNTSQYDSETNTWTSTLASFSEIGKRYVDCLLYGGETTAKEFLDKWVEISATGEKINNIEIDDTLNGTTTDTTELKAELETLKTAADAIYTQAIESEKNGVSNVAFVDLNQPTLDWLKTVTASGTVNNTPVTNEKKLSDFYFTTGKGSATDGTHPNDAGADALAHKFFTTADVKKYPALAPLMTEVTEGVTSKQPVPVSAEIVNAGYPSNSYWPTYVSPVSYDYAAAIKRVNFAEDGTLESVDINVQDNMMMSGYSQAWFAVYNKETGAFEKVVLSTDHIDNTNSPGPVTLDFTTELKLEENQTYKVFLWGYKDDPTTGSQTTMTPYAKVYEESPIEKYLITGEEGDIETFEYYGKETLDGAGEWFFGGSADKDLTLGKDKNISYATIKSTGNGNSFFVMKDLTSGTGNSGRYMIETDIKYNSGNNLRFGLSKGYSKSSPFISNGIDLFKIGTDGAVTVEGTEVGTLLTGKWTTLKYILDMDKGIATVSVGESDAETVSVSAYNQYEILAAISDLTSFYIDGSKAAFDVMLSNMTIAKLVDEELEDKTAEVLVDKDCANMGSVYIENEGVASKTVKQGENVKITAKADAGYEFSSWKDEKGNFVSSTPEFTARMYKDTVFTAVFEESEVDPITYFYKEDFKQLATSNLSDNGWVSLNGQAILTVDRSDDTNIENYLKFGPDPKSRGAVKTFDSTYESEHGIVFSANAKFNKGTKDGNEITIHGGNIVYNESINYGSVSGYILSLRQDTAGAVTVNGSESTIPNDVWFTVTAVCDFTTHKITVNVTSMDGQTSYFEDEVDMNDAAATGIRGIYIKEGRENTGIVSMDNIKIFTADQLS